MNLTVVWLMLVVLLWAMILWAKAGKNGNAFLETTVVLSVVSLGLFLLLSVPDPFWLITVVWVFRLKWCEGEVELLFSLARLHVKSHQSLSARGMAFEVGGWYQHKLQQIDALQHQVMGRRVPLGEARQELKLLVDGVSHFHANHLWPSGRRVTLPRRTPA